MKTFKQFILEAAEGSNVTGPVRPAQSIPLYGKGSTLPAGLTLQPLGNKVTSKPKPPTSKSPAPAPKPKPAASMWDPDPERTQVIYKNLKNFFKVK